jgi:hypothetical protein
MRGEGAVLTYVKESTVGELIGDTFRIYAKNLLPLFIICLVPLAPVELLKAAATSAQNEPLVAISVLLSLLVGIFVYGALTVAVSDICLGNPPTLKRSYSAIGRVMGKYLGTYLLLVLVVIIGTLLLVIPGIVAMVLLLFALPVTVIERKGGMAALKRSVALGKGFYWRNLGVLILAALVAAGCMIPVFVVIFVLVLVSGASAEDFGFNVILSLGNILVTPLGQIPLILLYYDMRARKEFFDGSALAQEMFA